MNARYVILRVLLEAGEGLVQINRFSDNDGLGENIEILLNREKIRTVGKTAIRNFLLRLQVYKSTGDVFNGTTMFSSYSEVPDSMLLLRNIVMARKEPRRLLVQPNILSTYSQDFVCKEYPGSSVGMIQSFVDRFKSNYDATILQLRAAYVENSSFM